MSKIILIFAPLIEGVKRQDYYNTALDCLQNTYQNNMVGAFKRKDEESQEIGKHFEERLEWLKTASETEIINAFYINTFHTIKNDLYYIDKEFDDNKYIQFWVEIECDLPVGKIISTKHVKELLYDYKFENIISDSWIKEYLKEIFNEIINKKGIFIIMN